MSDPIYLDHNATTPLLPEVVDAMIPYLREHFGNPSSGHVYGRRAHAAVEQARSQVASLLGCAPDEVVFTGGGTEANNLAIRGAHASNPGEVVTSVIEHPATSKPCAWLERFGTTVHRLGVDSQGQVSAAQVAEMIGEHTSLVTVMHANNETGVVQPIRAIAQAARAAGAVIHTDAAQSLGKVPVRVDELGVDLLSIAGHKLYAPKGVGALYVRRGTQLAPFALGAGHERGIRPGTENVASIVGLGVACAAVERDLAELQERQRALRDRLFERLRAAIPELALNGHAAERLPNTLSVRFPGVTGDEVLAHTPEVAASTGSACHEGETSASAVILAMGVDPAEAVGTVRLTLGRHTDDETVLQASSALIMGFHAAR